MSSQEPGTVQYEKTVKDLAHLFPFPAGVWYVVILHAYLHEYLE